MIKLEFDLNRLMKLTTDELVALLRLVEPTNEELILELIAISKIKCFKFKSGYTISLPEELINIKEELTNSAFTVYSRYFNGTLLEELKRDFEMYLDGERLFGEKIINLVKNLEYEIRDEIKNTYLKKINSKHKDT